jgi:hypothetical protein
MMPKLLKGGNVVEATLAVTADNANVSTDGKLNIIGVFQEFTPEGFTALVPQLTLVISWNAEPPEFGSQKEVHISFMGPDPHERVALPPMKVTIPQGPRPGEPAITHKILNLRGLPLRRSGPHAFYVQVGGETKARIPLYVREPTEQQ